MIQEAGIEEKSMRSCWLAMIIALFFFKPQNVFVCTGGPKKSTSIY